MLIKKKFTLLLILIFTSNCSFDNKTGIWGDSEKEKAIASEIEKRQKEILEVIKIYSTENTKPEEVTLKKDIIISKPKKNESWTISSLNNENLVGNIYLSASANIFLKKKIGKNKFSITKNKTTLLALNNNLLFSDDKGTIYNVTLDGKINWKKNIYKKVYKKIYKNLSLAIFDNTIYIADNIGFIYAINFINGEIIWIKNHGTALKSNIKVFNNKLFLIDQDNRLLSLDTNNGTRLWDVRSISSFIKTQNLLSLALSKKGEVLVITSSGDLIKVNEKNGEIYWSLNTARSTLSGATDFFKSSNIVLNEGNIYFSSGQTFFSYNLLNGKLNWEQKLSAVGTPIIDKSNIFLITENGFFIILNKDNGKIISSNNILKILKEKNQTTKITGYIMGSGKIYSVTRNGYLLISSASSGKTESYKKLAKSISVSPIINDNMLFILTENSKIIGLN
jgi:outer membrane protein assembly factor BamB